MVHVAKRNLNRCPTHPGALLREDVIPPTGRIKAKIAQIYLSPTSLRYFAEVSPAVAVRLGKLFGDGADPFLCKDLANATATIRLALCDQIKRQLEDIRDFFQSCGCSFSPTTFQVGNVALPDVGLVRDVELRLTTPFTKCP